MHNTSFASFNSIFYSISKDQILLLDNYLARKLQKDPFKGSYYSGIAEYWMRNIPIKHLNEFEFIDAIPLLSIFVKKEDLEKNK